MAVGEARGRSVNVQSTVAPEILRPLSGWGLVALSFTNVAIAYEEMDWHWIGPSLVIH